MGADVRAFCTIWVYNNPFRFKLVVLHGGKVPSLIGVIITCSKLIHLIFCGNPPPQNAKGCLFIPSRIVRKMSMKKAPFGTGASYDILKPVF
jgi:hypothetical protein